MKKDSNYNAINPRDYMKSSPWDLRDQAMHEAQRGGTPERMAELFKLADSKENKLFRDPARHAIKEGFDTPQAYLDWCAAVGIAKAA